MLQEQVSLFRPTGDTSGSAPRLFKLWFCAAHEETSILRPFDPHSNILYFQFGSLDE